MPDSAQVPALGWIVCVAACAQILCMFWLLPARVPVLLCSRLKCVLITVTSSSVVVMADLSAWKSGKPGSLPSWDQALVVALLKMAKKHKVDMTYTLRN